MKRPEIKWSMVVAFGVLMPILAGCAADAGVKEADKPQAQQTAPGLDGAVPSTNNLPVPAGVKAEAPSTVDPTNLPAKPVAAPVASMVGLNAAAEDLAKLAQSGVAESVMLAFVTNSASSFCLNADQVVYLMDIGVPSSVVTAMIQQDQALKGQVPAPVPPVVASDTNVPSPDQVAPQGKGGGTATESVPPAPQGEVTQATFESTLSPYGTWYEVEGYGRVWQPTVVVANSSWQPYFHGGRWVYTDCGWYWYSSYSWGWAPFHYGRWFRHYNLGWCWTPGYVWGPSWVTWRYNDSYCGWAPLPPAACYAPGFGFTYYGSSVSVGFHWGLSSYCYAYVPMHRVCAPYPYMYGVPHGHAAGIHNNTTIATQIYGNNNTVIVNNGLPVDRVNRATGGQVAQYRVSDMPSGSGRGERMNPAQNQLAVYRPGARPQGGGRAGDRSEVSGSTVSGANPPRQLDRSGAIAKLDRTPPAEPPSPSRPVGPTPPTARGSSRGTPLASEPFAVNPDGKQPVTTPRPGGSAVVGPSPSRTQPAATVPSTGPARNPTGVRPQQPSTTTVTPGASRPPQPVRITPSSAPTPGSTISRPVNPAPAGPSPVRISPGSSNPSRPTVTPSGGAGTPASPGGVIRNPSNPAPRPTITQAPSAPAAPSRITRPEPATGGVRITPSAPVARPAGPTITTPTMTRPVAPAPSTIQAPGRTMPAPAPSYQPPRISPTPPPVAPPQPSYSAPGPMPSRSGPPGTSGGPMSGRPAPAR